MKATYRVFDASAASHVKAKLGDLFFTWVKIGRKALHNGGTPILCEEALFRQADYPIPTRSVSRQSLLTAQEEIAAAARWNI